MNGKEQPPQVTKSGLLLIGVITAILIFVTFYVINKYGALQGDEWIVVAIGLPILALVAFVSIKIGRKNYQRLENAHKEDKQSFQWIRSFGFIAMLFGALLLGKQDFVQVLLGLLLEISGFGLILIKNWARLAFIILGAIVVSLILSDFIIGNTMKEVSNISQKSGDYLIAMFVFLRLLIIGIFISGIYYFTRPKVKEQFKQS